MPAVVVSFATFLFFPMTRAGGTRDGGGMQGGKSIPPLIMAVLEAKFVPLKDPVLLLLPQIFSSSTGTRPGLLAAPTHPGPMATAGLPILACPYQHRAADGRTCVLITFETDNKSAC